MRTLRNSLALAAIGLLLLLGTACGAAGSTSKVRVSGTVARSCPGPLILGRPPRCSDRAVLERDGRDFTVHGRFSIELPRGVYRVSVDSCAHQQTIHIKHRISGLKLVPRCAIPL